MQASGCTALAEVQSSVSNTLIASSCQTNGKGTVLSPSPKRHDASGSGKNSNVETQRHVLGVVEVVLQLLIGIFHGCAVGIEHLRPACNAWLYTVPQAVEGHTVV